MTEAGSDGAVVDPRVISAVAEALRRLARDTADEQIDQHDDRVIHLLTAH